MSLSESIRQKLIVTFLVEQREHLQQLTQGLLALEKAADDAGQQPDLDEIFRAAHSMKGSARAVGMTTIEGLSHALEELLVRVKEDRLALSSNLFDLLYQGLDAVELVLTQVEAGNMTSPAKALLALAALEEAVAMDAADNGRVPQPPALPTIPEPEQQNEPEPPILPFEEAGFEPDEAEAFEPVLPFAPIMIGASDEETAEPVLPFKQSSEETIRVSVSKLDALMAQFSELVAAKIRAEQRLAEMRQIQTFAMAWHKEWSAFRTDYHRLIRKGGVNGREPYNKEMTAVLDYVSRNQEHLRFLTSQANTLHRRSANDLMRLSLIIDELEEEVKRVRMLPLNTITATFGRMVRDLARQHDKRISFVLVGGETELDKRVLEQVKDPLIHLLRNAADHGIETTAVRQKLGKPLPAQITLSAGLQDNNVVISLQDDGAGLDPDTLRQTAVARGIITQAEADYLSDKDAANLIFRSGFSTSQVTTDISGRGVGMDIVRQNVTALDGELIVDFKPGEGTTFTMILPLTLTSARGLLLRAGEQIFALPLTAVDRMLRVNPAHIKQVEGKDVIVDQEQPVAVVPLTDLLGIPVTAVAENILTVVIIKVAERRLGLIVDNLLGEQEIVSKKLGKQLAKVSGFSGGTLLGSGEVVLVLNGSDLIKLAQRPTRRLHVQPKFKFDSPTRAQKTVLVVDDSITTRTLEKNILEAKGYHVRLATNGEEALSTLLEESVLPDIIVTDINMPRLNGFDLTSRIKRDNRFQEIPVILVTSLDSPADKARGIEVGADAYIVKSRFNQDNLVETIEQLIL